MGCTKAALRFTVERYWKSRPMVPSQLNPQKATAEPDTKLRPSTSRLTRYQLSAITFIKCRHRYPEQLMSMVAVKTRSSSPATAIHPTYQFLGTYSMYDFGDEFYENKIMNRIMIVIIHIVPSLLFKRQSDRHYGQVEAA